MVTTMNRTPPLHYTTTLKFKHFISYLPFEPFTLKFSRFIYMYTTEPPLTEGIIFFFQFLHCHHHQEDTPLHCTTTLKLKNVISYLPFEPFTLKFSQFLCMHTTKHALTEGIIFFLNFYIVSHNQEDTPLNYTITFFSFFLPHLRFEYFTLKFRRFLCMHTTKPALTEGIITIKRTPYCTKRLL